MGGARPNEHLFFLFFSAKLGCCFLWLRLEVAGEEAETVFDDAGKRSERPILTFRPRHKGPSLIDTPFATRCSKKAKSWRNAHKTGAAGATAQLGLTGAVGGRGSVHNTRVQPLVCAVSPANTLATPIPLRLTADAIMQDLHQTGCSSNNLGREHNQGSTGAALVRGATPALLRRLRMLVTARWWAGGAVLLCCCGGCRHPTPHPLGGTSSRYEGSRNRPDMCWRLVCDAYQLAGQFLAELSHAWTLSAPSLSGAAQF